MNFPDADENDKLKGKLYPYLRERAKRRMETQSGVENRAEEEQFVNDQVKSNEGALLSGLSDMQSMVGTLGGKRSENGIVQNYYKRTNDAAQQRYKNQMALREGEEASAHTDLGIADYLNKIDTQDKDRKFRNKQFDAGEADKTAQRQYLYDRLKQEKELAAGKKPAGMAYKESEMIGADGSSWVFDPEHGGYRPSGLPRGTKPYQRPMAAGAGPGFGSVVPGYTDGDGNPVTYNPKTGKTGTVQLPPGAKNNKPDRSALSEKQMDKINTFDDGLDLLKTIIAEKPQVHTGPWEDVRNKAAAKVGMDDPKISGFRSSVQDRLAAYIHQVSGSAASDKERGFLMQNIPTMADSDASFLEKANRVYQHLSANRERYVTGLARIGKDPSAFAAPPAAPAGNAPAGVSQLPPPNGKVKMKNDSTGEQLWVDPNDVEAARGDGFKETK